jgi:hypothetical protein
VCDRTIRGQQRIAVCVDVLDGQVVRRFVPPGVRDRDVVAAQDRVTGRGETDRTRPAQKEDAHV